MTFCSIKRILPPVDSRGRLITQSNFVKSRGLYTKICWRTFHFHKKKGGRRNPDCGKVYDPQRQKPLIFWLLEGGRGIPQDRCVFIYLYSSPSSVSLCVLLGRLSLPTGAGSLFPTLLRVSSWKKGEERSRFHDVNISLLRGLMLDHVYNHLIFSACSAFFSQNKPTTRRRNISIFVSHK